ncbi:polyphosphate kinase [Anaerocolumna cellulosilytica]|uniref:Polyphosphate kinase n=1 Tax=Anaerocolumna cellulosilytica TaxID=433286 RepID=A0A6S6RAQ1_9FIRM|nr:polyphosphate kinase 1 [Anaerocolumna cellulosilytica]MBB5195389.1 polyphosphate kinase [Anaerocolumna cellulosilytica]BCJ95921.1 polyphosphate kinase [Anaerocolumna cellulosilytica]
MAQADHKIQNTFMQNREISWLRFNERVLEEAQDETVPFYERLKFVSIFTSNLDEFFMIRVGSLVDLGMMDNTLDNKTGMSPKQQLDKIFEYTIPLCKKKDNIYQLVEQKLRQFDVFNLNIKELEKSERKYLDKYYHNEVSPILSPQVIDSRHPFPHLINKGLYIICEFAGENTKFGLISISQSLKPYVLIPGNQTRYILTEKIVLEHIAEIFGMYKIECGAIISVTRNADISPEDEIFEVDDDFRERMRKVLKKRARLSPVRLEVQGRLSKVLTNFLLERLCLTKEQIFFCEAPIVMGYVFDIVKELPDILQKQLCYPVFEPGYPAGLSRGESITNQCRRKDILLFYPYHQMEPFLHLLRESAQDSNVISIKITIYRLSKNSRIIDYLCTAAENNKEVTVLMELKARFDEKNNIEWAERLEEAGCTVIYGFEGYKVHSKICLITRRDRSKIQYITQIGTGNYNEKTAKLYTDLSLITANQDLGQEANEFFKNMSLGNLKGQYSNLFVAPHFFKDNLLALMDYEIEKAKRGEAALIIIKSNSLTDKEIMQKLSGASMAGVEVKLLIRGICCLLPNVPGKTDNITVYSIVGRFLEHSRIYCFGKDKEARIYISSADMMTRNTIRRVEIACPILDEDLRKCILHILNTMFSDNIKARILKSDGTYQKTDNCPTLESDQSTALEVAGGFDSQQYFIEEMLADGNETKKSSVLFRKLITSLTRKKE